MPETTKIIRVGGSLAIIVPKETIKSMRLYRNQTLLIRNDEHKMEIEKLSDILDKLKEKEDS